MLKKEQYLKTVLRPYPPLFSSIVMAGASNPENYKVIISRSFAIKNFIQSENYWYYSKPDMAKGSKLAFEEFNNPKRLRNAIKIFKQREKNFLASTKKDFKSFAKAYAEYMPALILVWLSDEPFENRMKELIYRKLPREEADSLMNELNIPLQDNYYKKEEYELVKTKDLKKHAKKWYWINSRYGQENYYTLEQAEEKLSKINKKEYFRKYKEEKAHLKKTIAHTKKLLGKDASMVDFMQFIIYYRTHRTDTINLAITMFIPKLKDMTKKLGLTYQQLLRCTRDEVLNNKIPDRTILDQRINDFTLLLHRGELKCLIGKKSEEIREFLKEDVSDIKELEGQIACKGKVTGKVKLVFTQKDYTKVQDGDILVTSMTTPNMVPIMKKASAFITDEGGITCHAAIISREMKKPCIIGTKNATQILKDNDKIEVDADKGVVRKVK